ncbi:MAG: 4Fe-4S binding protein [Candidatus Eisenbacteria bacterium]|jgi:ferredoxin|nr:4Fe-4S binding protein [Candidatus Eisenbacteria bacterium]
MPVRQIIRIDEEKCDGCGLCATACAEGAIAIIDGKARLVSETYCDGLGACLGECPRGAITMEEREAPAFDEEAVMHAKAAAPPPKAEPLPCGCPGSQVRAITACECSESPAVASTEDAPSCLRNWPVQMKLVPVSAPYLRNADLVIAADCVPFAFASFHQRFLPGRVLLVGCPKLDDAGFYRGKLADIFRLNNIRSLEVVHMEVPCCSGLVRLALGAAADAHACIPVTLTKIGIAGDVLESHTVAASPLCGQDPPARTNGQ